MRRRQTRWSPRADSSATAGPGLARRRQRHRSYKFRPDLLACFVFMKTDLPPAGRRFTSRRWNAINKGSLQSKRIVSTWQRRRARRRSALCKLAVANQRFGQARPRLAFWIYFSLTSPSGSLLIVPPHKKSRSKTNSCVCLIIFHWRANSLCLFFSSFIHNKCRWGLK